jgi:serine protease Do
MQMTVLEELEGAIQAAAERTGPKVIGLGQGWGRGSGVVIGPNQVLTNAHNLRGDEVTVTFLDGRREAGRVLASDHDLDVAVIEADTGGIEPIEWSDELEDSVPIGRSVLALANPGGRGLRVTPGFVSSTERSFRGPRGRRIRGAIEHTAPLPRGSGGSPLLNADGLILGLNAIRRDEGFVVAWPAGVLRDRVAALAAGARTAPPRLGVALVGSRQARRLRAAVGLEPVDGLLVRAVEEGSPADRSGIARGDVIVAVDGSPLSGADPLYAALDRAGGRELELDVVRGTDRLTLTTRLEAGNEQRDDG